MARDLAGGWNVRMDGNLFRPDAPAAAAAKPRFHLARRFVAAGGVVMLVGMLGLGSWVSAQIESGVVRNSAAATALFMEGFVAPLVQELRDAERLSPAAVAALAAAFADTALGARVASYKLWKHRGTGAEIVHASNPELIGRSFPATPELLAAFRGEVSAAFGKLGDREDAAERALGEPLLEIYAPVRARRTGEIIAVAEFYERAERLEEELAAARQGTWLVVAAVMLGMAAALFGIVQQGSRIIARQARAIDRQLDNLAALAAQNAALSRRIRRASSRVAELNERYLRRLSAELHDGPAQLLGFALLRLDAVVGPAGTAAAGTDANAKQILREALERALAEMRQICRGLALPDLAAVDLEGAARLTVAAHRELTGTEVELVSALPTGFDVAQPAKICTCRFIQEGLANATRHAGGKGQGVRIALEGGELVAEVSDRGPGFAACAPGETAAGGGLGLAGLRERVESLGGSFSVGAVPGGGARIAMRLHVNEGGSDDGHG